MEEEFDQSKDDQYCDMFNNGYLLAKHEPELFRKIEPSLDKDNPLLQGKRQYEIEKAKSFFKQFDRGNNGQSKTPDKDIDR